MTGIKAPQQSAEEEKAPMADKPAEQEAYQAPLAEPAQ